LREEVVPFIVIQYYSINTMNKTSQERTTADQGRVLAWPKINMITLGHRLLRRIYVYMPRMPICSETLVLIEKSLY
jgi:hypothetical protein